MPALISIDVPCCPAAHCSTDESGIKYIVSQLLQNSQLCRAAAGVRGSLLLLGQHRPLCDDLCYCCPLVSGAVHAIKLPPGPMLLILWRRPSSRSQKGPFDHSVLQRMEGDDRQAASWRERINCIWNRRFQSAQLIIHSNAQRLQQIHTHVLLTSLQVP